MKNKNYKRKDRTISIRLTDDMLQALNDFVEEQNSSKTEVVREALRNYLNLPPQSFDNRLKDLEQRVSFIEDRLDSQS
ncbi:MAG: ribbon-helix-helix domain-containing protein [Cyanobacteria bacterium J06621_8]